MGRLFPCCRYGRGIRSGTCAHKLDPLVSLLLQCLKELPVFEDHMKRSRRLVFRDIARPILQESEDFVISLGSMTERNQAPCPISGQRAILHNNK